MTFARLITRFAAAALLPTAGSALAHHAGATHSMGWADGLRHLLTEPDHLALLALAVAVGVAGVKALRARRGAWRQPPRQER